MRIVTVKSSAAFFVGVLLCLFSQPSKTQENRTYQIRIPTHCQAGTTAGAIIPLDPQAGEYKIVVPPDTPIEAYLTITDPFGAHKNFPFSGLDTTQPNIINETKVATPAANPEIIDNIPRLCPRVYTQKDAKNVTRFVYDARSDILNARPALQLLDPDVHDIDRQKSIIGEIDHKNSLRLKRIRISYDYEDNQILDYQGPHPMHPETEEVIYEGEGGFYANFHYAIMPYDPRYLKLDRQETLHLTQGKLAEINRKDLTPPVRVHSLLPGPYFSKNGVYTMCEWGDTAYQAKQQELYYHGMVLWDWDIRVGDHPVEKLILIVWEGDEEDWMIADGLLDPFYITDDLVGTFVIEHSKTERELVLMNEAKNFEIEVVMEM